MASAYDTKLSLSLDDGLLAVERCGVGIVTMEFDEDDSLLAAVSDAVYMPDSGKSRSSAFGSIAADDFSGRGIFTLLSHTKNAVGVRVDRRINGHVKYDDLLGHRIVEGHVTHSDLNDLYLGLLGGNTRQQP